MTTFNCEVKYRGCIQVTHWAPSPEAPRPGLIEANACVKRIMEQAKQSTTVVLSAAAAAGIKCVDTGFTPPKVIMQNSVYEIAHCGVDVSKPRLFTCIVGTKGENPQFFCHVFKCESKEAASKTTRAVAAVCTEAFQSHKAGGPASGGGAPQQKFAPPSNAPPSKQGDSALIAKQRNMRRQSMKKGHKTKVVAALTDDWFTPAMARDEVTRRLKDARVGDFFIRESSSNPGDYAIGVQSGKQIWTGLIHASGDGYQLGNKGNDLFEELIILVSHYMSNSFMNDDFGYPLMLRMPKAQEMRQASGGGGGGGYAPPAQQYAPPAQQYAPPAQQYAPPAQQYAPPAQQYAPPAQQFAPPAAAAPAGGWPAADDADDDMAEFERFMDSAAVRGDDLLDANGEVNMSALDMAMGSATVAAPAAMAGSAAARAPAPMLAPKKTVQSIAGSIAATLPKDAEGCMSGADVRPVLMKTGLQIAALGKVWMDVDDSQRGKVDTDQLALILSLIAQVQNGGVPNLATIDPTLLPKVEGF